MTISLRLSETEDRLIRTYAEMKGISVSEFLRRSALEKIEDEYDLDAYRRAMDEYRKDSSTYSLDDVEKELGIK